MGQELVQRAIDIIQTYSAAGAKPGEEAGVVLALIDAEGYPTASTLSVAKADGIRELWFGTGLGSNKAKRIEKCNRASVCFSTLEYNITLVGDIEIRTDPETRKASWYEGMSNHFSGPDDPNYCVLVFTTRRYNLFVDWKEEAGRL